MTDKKDGDVRVKKVMDTLINRFSLPIQGIEKTLKLVIKGAGEGEQRAMQDALERLGGVLEHIDQELSAYSEDQKGRSQLSVAVKVVGTSLTEWASLVESGKPPKDLVQNIQKKIDELDACIQGEQIRFGCAIEKKVDLAQFFSKVNAKKPMEYYKDGKTSLVNKQWVDAKKEFLAYQCYADARRQKTLPPELEKLEMKDPHEDQHLEYLEYLQKKLDEATSTPEDPELALLWSKKAYSNPYTQAKLEWRSIYPLRKEAPKPPAPSSTPSSTSSTTSSTESTFTGTTKNKKKKRHPSAQGFFFYIV